jgi:hypothetical protein
MTEAEGIWRSKSDDDLIEAAAELGTYTADGQRIIRAELKRRGLEDPFEQADFTPVNPGVELPEAEAPAPMCLRCEVRLRYVGEKTFREGGNLGVFGEIGHLFEQSASFHVWVCRNCGHVDFFLEPGGDT